MENRSERDGRAGRGKREGAGFFAVGEAEVLRGEEGEGAVEGGEEVGAVGHFFG